MHNIRIMPPPFFVEDGMRWACHLIVIVQL